MPRQKTTRHLPDIARNVLQDPGRTREQAAWLLLHAVRDLFPARLAELRKIGSRFSSDYIGELGEGDEHNMNANEIFRRAVDAWAVRNRISCTALDEAAAKYALGEGPNAGLYVDADIDDPEFVDRTSSIKARPYHETRQEFLDRAADYYDEIVAGHVARGAPRGPVKRESNDHFRYLAAHLVGGHSFADIARDAGRFKVLMASEKTVAGEARKTARLLGLQLRSKPGPRPGVRVSPAASRVRR